MAPLTEWNKAVKTAFKMGRKTNKNYSLKNAMFDAKKIYKKGSNAVMNLGRRTMNKRNNRRRKYKAGSTLNPTPL
jgi:hypothetical protein